MVRERLARSARRRRHADPAAGGAARRGARRAAGAACRSGAGTGDRRRARRAHSRAARARVAAGDACGCPGRPRSTRPCPTRRCARCRSRCCGGAKPGCARSAGPGEGRLFEGLREWVPGDETRIIDWKATARRGKPIARQYEDERRQQVLIVIDAGRLLTAEVDGVARLESVVVGGAAAGAGRGGARRQRRPDGLRRHGPALRGAGAAAAARSGRCSTGWRTAEGRLVESDYPAAFRYLAAHNRKRALTVLFTDVIDRTASEALVAHAATLRPRHLPLAVTLRDPALEALATARPVSDGRGLRARGRRGAARRARGGAGRDARPRGHGAGRAARRGRRGGGRAVPSAQAARAPTVAFG